MHERYRDDDRVAFIGLTHEGAASVEESKAFLRQTGITWPNGYGAEQTLEEFGVSAIPSTWVIGPDGKVVWNHDSPGDVGDGIEQALAMLQ